MNSNAEIFEAANGSNITLNGKPAVVSGRLMSFATVRQLDGFSAEFSWPAVKHVIENREGKFRT